MACLTSCNVCGVGLTNQHICNECSLEFARACLEDRKITREEVAEIVAKNRIIDIKKEMNRKALEAFDMMGRNNWKNYKNLVQEAMDMVCQLEPIPPGLCIWMTKAKKLL